MNHLRARLAAADLAETTDLYARRELRLLLPREMEKAQRQLSTAVADSHKQAAPPAENGLGQQNLARDETACADFQRRTDAF